MIPLVLALLAQLHVPAHACRFEDGTPQRGEVACIWNARTMGNGHGESFVAVTDGASRMFVYQGRVVWL